MIKVQMNFKKEVKHSVVYETDAQQVPIRSVYVSKDWLTMQGHDFRKPIEVTVECKS